MTGSNWDVIVIGGGIAGVSIGYELAEHADVCLLEMEATLAYHTTGRSAAAFLETYGNHEVRALTTASRHFFSDPPDIFEAAISAPLPLLYIAHQGMAEAVRQLHAEVCELSPHVRVVDGDEAERINPLLRPGYTELGLEEPGALDLDVHELHQGFTRGLRRRNGTVVTSARIVAAARDGSAWVVTDGSGREYRASIVVNAAGAWCDHVARLFGAQPIGIRPLRRTIFIVPAPDDRATAGLPLTIELDDSFYFKPELGQYLCSPADETPQSPGDARPDEVEIARALDAINAATLIGARHVRSRWAGLRSFAPDKTPVVGFDPAVSGLFWYAGQGGYGIQMCPALARTGAALLLGRPLPDDVAARGLDAFAVSPARPALRGSR